MQWIFDDGGRVAAGFKGSAGDCVCRAVAIAAKIPYDEVYSALAEGYGSQRLSVRDKRRGKSRHASTARNGINVRRKWFKDYMARLGFRWVPTMHIGSGCQVHLADGELPPGRLIVSVSKHYTTVIDGVIRDTFDPQRHWIETGVRDGQPYRREYGRCVYGYWIKEEKERENANVREDA